MFQAARQVVDALKVRLHHFNAGLPGPVAARNFAWVPDKASNLVALFNESRRQTATNVTGRPGTGYTLNWLIHVMALTREETTPFDSEVTPPWRLEQLTAFPNRTVSVAVHRFRSAGRDQRPVALISSLACIFIVPFNFGVAGYRQSHPASPLN